MKKQITIALLFVALTLALLTVACTKTPDLPPEQSEALRFYELADGNYAVRVSDPAVAATLLTDTYCNWDWHRD